MWREPSNSSECERQAGDEGASGGGDAKREPERRGGRPVATEGRGRGCPKAAPHGAPVQWLHEPEVVHHLVSGRVVRRVELHRAQHFQLNA